jgi:hypothetical protein
MELALKRECNYVMLKLYALQLKEILILKLMTWRKGNT